MGFCFDQEYRYVRPDLSGVLSGVASAKSEAMGWTGAKPDDNMIQVAVPKRHIIQNQTTIEQ